MSNITMIDIPVPFSGTDEERAANWRTHNHGGEDGRCIFCDAKGWHAAADYKCGQEPPRMRIEQSQYRKMIGL